MSILDSIVKIKQEIFSTVNSDYTGETFEIDGNDSGFALSVNLSNGNGSVDILVSVYLSVDGVSFAEVGDTITPFSDDSGTIMYDILDTNTTYMRIGIKVNGGSIDLQTIDLTAKRRH